jgi:hypothetical protein
MRRRAKTGWLSLFAIFSISAFLVLQSAPAVARQASTPIASPASNAATGPLPPAWLEFGPNGQLLARVLVEKDCPPLLLDGIETAMRPRSAPSTDFSIVACEATIPFGVTDASIFDQTLPLPSGPPTRIAVIGDTGCRLNDWEHKYQSCDDPTAWPFAQVAASVAAWRPDLIVHVGDYLYRESPCPASGFDCIGSPHGDNWPTWNADFFRPASPLFGIASLIFMRGNHETCDRNAGGWFAYLDSRPFHIGCQAYTDPFVINLKNLTFAVLDSAEAADETVKPGEEEEYRHEFALLAALAPNGSWLVTHRPVWGIFTGTGAETEGLNATYQAATGDTFKGKYALILSGHVHLAETLAFIQSSERPPQLISGNAGTALDNIPTASPSAGELGDPDVEEAETLSSFGFLTLEPDGAHWVATQRNAEGDPLRTCAFDLPEISCTSSR